MKKIAIMSLLAILLTFSLAVGVSVAAKVDSVNGKVVVVRGDSSLEVKKGMELEENDLIKTEKDASVTVFFLENVTGTLKGGEEIKVSDFYIKSKINSFKGNINKPSAGSSPEKIETITIGGTRGTEEGEKKSKSLKNEHSWEEKVE